MGVGNQTKASKSKALEHYKADCPERDAGDRWITMTNALTRAGHGLSLAEKRIVMAAVSKMDSRRAVMPGTAPVTRITAMEFAELFGVDTDTAYDQLQAAAKQLYNRSITFFEQAAKRRGKALEPTRVTMRWVGGVKYQKGEGWVELAWWHQVMPHLTGIKKQFTTYQLKQASALRSVYSWRLLELLTRFQSSGKAEYTIEDFKASMDAPPSLSDFAQVKRRIIEPAVKELTEKDGWLIQWEPVKRGRRVASVRFTFMRDPQGRLL